MFAANTCIVECQFNFNILKELTMMSDKKGPGKFRVSGLAFSTYEKRAIWLLVAFLLIGAGVRFYKHKLLSDKLNIWVDHPENSPANQNDDLSHGKRQESRLQMKIDLNHAEQEGLCRLPGIGTVKADAIIDFREKHGHFKKVDDLGNVYGIGSAMIENFRELVFVDTASDSSEDKRSEED